MAAATDSVVLVVESTPLGEKRVVAHDTIDGAERWRLSLGSVAGISLQETGDVNVAALPVNVGGTSYTAGIELGTGSEVWRSADGLVLLAQAPEIVVLARPTTVENGVPVGGLVGVARSTGEERWVNDDVVYQDLGSGTGSAPLTGDVLAVPVIDITQPAAFEALAGVDVRDGSVLWTAASLPDAVAADGVVVGIDDQGNIRAIDAADGTTRWSATGNRPHGVPLAVGDGLLVVTDDSSGGREVVGYELASGERRWRTPIPFVDTHVVADRAAILLWESELVGVSTDDGAVIWSLSSPLQTSYMNHASANGTTAYVAVNSLPWGD